MQFHQPLHATLHYRITTPMFLGGEGQAPDQNVFRAASFKGALRFWWRALNWQAALNKAAQNGHAGDRNAALKELHKLEGKLFGSASDSEGGASQQSRVLLRCELTSCGTLSAGDTSLNNVSYLLGQGLCSYVREIRTTKLTRAALKEGAQLDVHITIKPGDSAEADMAQVLCAAKALGCFGGLGSRARRGFGSLSLEWLNVDGNAEERFDSREALEGFIATLPRSAPWQDAPLTAFTSGFAHHIGACSSNALKALAAVNTAMWEYRSWKSPKQHADFEQDHQTAYDIADGKKAGIPLRAAFGLPHNYFLSSRQPKAKVDFGAKLSGTELRRASPLFIHIHALKEGNFVAVQAFLPAMFLPPKSRITFKSGRNTGDLTPLSEYKAIIGWFEKIKGARHA